MALPPLVHYAIATEYRLHYQRNYCRGSIQTFDGIRVFFAPAKFEHAFYESTQRDGRKDAFSPVRAERIDWIKATLENPQADLYQGWNKGARGYDMTSRVAVVYEDFVVVVALRLTREGALKANFVTCFQADNSIGKIRTSPAWTRADFLRLLGGGP